MATLRELDEKFTARFDKIDTANNNIKADLTQMKDVIIQNLIDENKKLSKKMQNFRKTS